MLRNNSSITNKIKFKSAEKIRVVDVVTLAHDNDLLFYDKKMSTVVTCIEYDKACKNNASNVKHLREKMHAILNEAYETCSAEIKKSTHCNIDMQSHLEKLAREMLDVQQSESISREIIEVACFKLAILCDLSRGVDVGVSINGGGDYDRLKAEKIKKLLMLPLTQIKEFKIEVGYVGSSALYDDFSNVQSILPIFSKNGSMGINTILYAYFNGYHPVGFGAHPWPVHANIMASQSVATIQHDYGHALMRVLGLQEKDPETFKKYKTVYNKLFEQKQLNLLDDMTFKKDLLMLFLLLHEAAYKPSDGYIADTVANRALLFEESNIHEFDTLSLINLILVEVVDFIKPLRDLGYEIADSNQVWKCSADVRIAFMDMLEGFLKRHPETGFQFDDGIENGDQLAQALSKEAKFWRFNMAIRRADKIQDISQLLNVCTMLSKSECFKMAYKVKHLIEDGDQLARVLAYLPKEMRSEFANEVVSKIQKDSRQNYNDNHTFFKSAKASEAVAGMVVSQNKAAPQLGKRSIPGQV